MMRDPHHTITDTALVGGGSYPQPGEISLAHNGVLFMDELPEFRRNVLEVLRQLMEGRGMTISRAKYTIEYPSNFMLVAAMIPCPCGYYNHPDRECNRGPGITCNARIGPALRRKFCVLDGQGQHILRRATKKFGLSARAYDRILKVFRTIADLEESERILPSHMAEAANYRNLDREGWSG